MHGLQSEPKTLKLNPKPFLAVAAQPGRGRSTSGARLAASHELGRARHSSASDDRYEHEALNPEP